MARREERAPPPALPLIGALDFLGADDIIDIIRKIKSEKRHAILRESILIKYIRARAYELLL